MQVNENRSPVLNVCSLGCYTLNSVCWIVVHLWGQAHTAISFGCYFAGQGSPE